MKIIAFAGSNSSTSINKQLVTYASSFLTNKNVEILDLNDFNIPMFSIDIEKREGFCQEIMNFYNKLYESDIILISFAEHNACTTAVIKSYLDWCSRINYKFLEGKQIFAMSTSPGGYGGKNALEAGSKLVLKLAGNVVVEYSLPKFNENFSDGKIINEEFNQELILKIEEFEKHF